MIPGGQDAGRNIEVLHRHVYRRLADGAAEQPLFTLPCSSLALAVQQGLEAHKLLQSTTTLKRTQEEEQQDSELFLEAARRAFPKAKIEVCGCLFPFH